MIETFLWRTYQVVFLALNFPLLFLVFIPFLAVFETVSNLLHLFRCFFPEKKPRPLSRPELPELEVLNRNQNEAKLQLNAFLKGSQENEPRF